MLTYESSEIIIKEHPWLKEHERDLESCIADEAQYWKNEDVDFPEAVETAHDLMLNWLDTAHEYRVDDDSLADIASFLANHRRACVWAVLISKAHKSE